MKTTVKDAKKKLNELLNVLNNYNENNEFVIELDDNCGGAYSCDINDFVVTVSMAGVVGLSNF